MAHGPFLQVRMTTEKPPQGSQKSERLPGQIRHEHKHSFYKSVPEITALGFSSSAVMAKTRA